MLVALACLSRYRSHRLLCSHACGLHPPQGQRVSRSSPAGPGAGFTPGETAFGDTNLGHAMGKAREVPPPCGWLRGPVGTGLCLLLPTWLPPRPAPARVCCQLSPR